MKVKRGKTRRKGEITIDREGGERKDTERLKKKGEDVCK